MSDKVVTGEVKPLLIEDYIAKKLEFKTMSDVSKETGISVPMISKYFRGEYKPSIATALLLYNYEGVVLHPFAEESLIFENKQLRIK